MSDIALALWLLIFIILVGILGTAYGFYTEKKSFNGGKCINCNTKLRLFDFDSHGGRGYTCNKCNRKVWVSYKRVDSDYLDDFFYGEVRRAVGDKKDE